MQEPIWKKAGFNSDIEYFQRLYAGKQGEVIKKTTKLGPSHPFFAIKRPVDPFQGKKRYEYKIYDLVHNGYIEKQIIEEDPDEPFPSLKQWFNRQNRGSTHFREYIQFCQDTYQ